MKVANVKFSSGNDLFKASFDLEFKGITIRRCKWMITKGIDWIAFPSEKYKDQFGASKYFQYIFIEPEEKQKIEKECLAQLKAMIETKPQDEVPF